ncbi:MAG: hypothetical protein IJF09_03335, partial [Ruminiclostridium sp.]|nr:hypothetical protein [Ruminiclostridium sp.]
VDSTTFAEGKYFIRQRRISSKPEVLISPCHRHDFILKFVTDKFQFINFPSSVTCGDTFSQGRRLYNTPFKIHPPQADSTISEATSYAR